MDSGDFNKKKEKFLKNKDIMEKFIDRKNTSKLQIKCFNILYKFQKSKKLEYI